MKKFFAAFVAVLMTLSCFSFVSAKEITLETGKGVGVAIEDVSATTDDTRIEVPISIAFAEDAGIAGAKIIVKYDTTKLDLIIEAPDEDEETPGSPYWTFKKAEATGQVNTLVAGQITANFAAATNSSAVKNGFFMLEFAPKAGASGDAKIWFETADMYFVDENGDDVAFQTADGKISFPVAKYNVTFATTIGTAPEAMNDVEGGTEITLPTLTDDELTFLGWTIAGSDTVYAAGSTFAVNGNVDFTAKWGGGRKIYISNDGSNDNDGFTAETPVRSLATANALLAEEGKDTLVVVGTFTTEANGEAIGVAGKAITVTGYADGAVFDYDNNKNGTDDNLVIAGPVTFENIAIYEGSGDGVMQARGNTVTFGEGITLAKADRPIEIIGYNGSPTINIESGSFARVFPGTLSGTYNGGTTTVNISGGTIDNLGLGWGWRGTNTHNGTYYANINGGTVKLMTLRSGGNEAANTYRGLRYYTINDGTVESIVTTGSSQYKNNANPRVVVNVPARTGVTVYEINKAGVVTGDIALGTNILTNVAEEDDATRLVIFNNGSYEEGKVTDPGAFVYNVKSGALKAVATVKDDYSAFLEGFTYTLPEGSTYNAVKFSDSEGEYVQLLGDELISPMSVAGTYDVEFVNAYSINLDNEDVLVVEAGKAADLPVYPAKGDLNHIGWATTEGATVPTIGLEDEYVPTGDTTLYSVWASFCNVTFETAYGEAPEGYKELATGTEITLPELESTDDIIFLGWTVGDSEEIIPGDTKYTLTGTVTFVAKWKSAGKLYLSDNGNDENGGLSVDAPVQTLGRAMEIVKTNSDITTIVVTDTYTLFGGTNPDYGAVDHIGVSDRELRVIGLTDTAVFSIDGNTSKNNDETLALNGDIYFDNITIQGHHNDGRIAVVGHTITFGSRVKAPEKSFAKIASQVANVSGSVFNLYGGTFANVFPAWISGNTTTGDVTINVDGAYVLNFGFGHGWKSQNKFVGSYAANIDSGKLDTVQLYATGVDSANAYQGLRYYTVNGGEIGKIITTSGSVFKANNADQWSNVAFRTGVTVFEINAADVVKGAIELGKNKQTSEYEADDAARVIIYNNNSYVEGQVTDTGAYVLNVKNGALKAVATELADKTKIAEWAASVELLGFSYTLPEEGTFNAVKVGEETYLLAELEGDLIPVPAAAGLADVEFTNVYKVTIGEDTTLVEEGSTIALTRLPQNGDLKHIGWATTEGATTATINHTTDYAPTADVTLYPVWAEAIYFTVSFVSAHGDAFDAISKIDDDEDGAADEAVVLPGYDTTIKYDDHFTFAGWAKTEGGEVVYAEGDSIEQLSENVVLYAVWTEDPKATVTYVDAQATAPEAVTDYVGTQITVAAPGTVEGFEFLGWTDGATIYPAGGKLTIDEDGATLTAKWGVKVTVDANGAKGELPVIGGTIGEEIDLPTSVELTKVNNTFVGFALTSDGEVITGKYTVNPEDTLYVIWEETVANAGIIETKVVYNSASGDYTVDMYFYGADANTVAFGYTYGENLEFVSFVPAEDLSKVPASLETSIDGYYAFAVTDTVDGRIEGADAEAGNGVHLGTLNFTYKLTKDDYSEDDAADNIAITAPAEVIEYISSEDYFLYTPAVIDLAVDALPVVFDEAIEYEIIDVVYAVNGSVKVVRADGTAPKNFAEIAAYVNGNLYKTFIIEDAETVTEDGVFEYSIELPAGEYTLVFDKAGYANAELELVVEAQEGAGEEGFEPTPVEVDLVTLVPGDVVEEAGVIDLLDFAAITSSFGRGELADEIVIALDINEDGAVTVDDLAYVKANFGYGA